MGVSNKGEMACPKIRPFIRKSGGILKRKGLTVCFSAVAPLVSKLHLL
jgi:hypothetical protein